MYWQSPIFLKITKNFVLVILCKYGFCNTSIPPTYTLSIECTLIDPKLEMIQSGQRSYVNGSNVEWSSDAVP